MLFVGIDTYYYEELLTSFLPFFAQTSFDLLIGGEVADLSLQARNIYSDRTVVLQSYIIHTICSAYNVFQVLHCIANAWICYWHGRQREE